MIVCMIVGRHSDRTQIIGGSMVLKERRGLVRGTRAGRIRSGRFFNLFIHRFREKTKPSARVYSQRDRIKNKVETRDYEPN